VHEMSLAQTVLAEVERCLEPYGSDARVVQVALQVGTLRAVIPQAMTFCFEVVTRGTRAQDAVLIIEEIALRTRCLDCGHEWLPDEAAFFCPRCDGPVEVLTGKELLLRSLVIDDGEAP
jgi:hydrogenase nickel incorporation protein HypA/HybF